MDTCLNSRNSGFSIVVKASLIIHGYINSMRYENTRNFNKYLDGKFRFNELLVSNREEIENELILGLRKLEGIDIELFKKKFNKDIFKEFKIDEAIKKGYIINSNNHLYIKYHFLCYKVGQYRQHSPCQDKFPAKVSEHRGYRPQCKYFRSQFHRGYHRGP